MYDLYKNLPYPFTFTTTKKKMSAGNLTDFLIFHLVIILHHTHIILYAPCLNVHHSGLTPLPWANSYVIQKQGIHHPLTSNPSRWMQSRLPDNGCNR